MTQLDRTALIGAIEMANARLRSRLRDVADEAASGRVDQARALLDDAGSDLDDIERMEAERG